MLELAGAVILRKRSARRIYLLYLVLTGIRKMLRYAQHDSAKPLARTRGASATIPLSPTTRIADIFKKQRNLGFWDMQCPNRTVLVKSLGILAIVVMAVHLTGCETTKGACGRSSVSCQLEQRTGYALGKEQPTPCPPNLPMVVLPDPLTEETAVLLALYHNAAFQELLAELKITRADLVQAGLLPNPELGYFFHVPDKPFKYVVDFPIEAIWLRPIRIAAAHGENERACQRLVQAGLDLIRDVRQAYADLLLAKQRLQVAERAVELRERVAKLAEARLQAGDASEQEVTTARIDALQSKQDAARIGYEVPLAEERLRNLLGVGDDRTPVVPESRFRELQGDIDADSLTAEAVRSRPDAAAANQAVAAARERVRLAKLGWFRFLGVLDATSGRATGREFGPAFRVTLPIFNQNQGGIARAEGELERAVRQQTTIHNQIVLDVRQAFNRFRQARAELTVLTEKVRPEVEAAIRRAEAAYKEGNASYLIVLETSRQLIDSYAREAQLTADARRAAVDLERSVGRRLDSLFAPVEILEEPSQR